MRVTFVCGTPAAPSDALRALAGLRTCCEGALVDGPMGCTCWEVEYDQPQDDPILEAPVETQPAMCDDCAFRPDSPERTGAAHVSNGSLDALLALPNFACHKGSRRAVRYRHRLGVVVEAAADGADYRPVIIVRDVDGVRVQVPYAADGLPLKRCAGWAAHHRDGAPVEPTVWDSGVEVEWDYWPSEPGYLQYEVTLWAGLWAEVARLNDPEGIRWQWKVLRSDDGHPDVIASGDVDDAEEGKRLAIEWAQAHRGEQESVEVGRLIAEATE